jgi:signal transduction histidine kinase/ActR/RegA family two-component response regulator
VTLLAGTDLTGTCELVNQLLEQPSLGVIALDRELRIERANPQRFADAMIGQPLLVALPGATALAALAERARDTAAAVSGEVTLAGPITVVATCSPIRAGDQVVGIACAIESADRERRGRELLAASTLTFAAYAGSEHRPVIASRAWRDTFGVVPPALLPKLDDAFTTGVPVHFREEALLASGDDLGLPRYFTGVIHPMHTVFGAIRGVTVVCSEVTDAVVARKLLVDPATALIWSGTAESIDYRSPALVALVGDSTAFIHADDVLDHASARETTAETTVELRLHRTDGEWRWHRARYIARGPRWFASAVPIDRSAASFERSRTALADARKQNLQKDQFIASLSHELRAPITTLLLWEKVLRDDPDPQLRERALDAIHQSAMSQSSLVADLLDVARAISGKLHIDLRPVMVAEILTAAVDQAEPLAAAKQLRIERQITEVGMVAGDANRLRQIFANLISNAIKFTEPGGFVVVAAHRERDTIAIDVSDSGRGISPELLPHVFDPFRQHSDLQQGDGLGLGLAIARQLAVAHGGTLAATSSGEGKGSQFTFTLRATTPHTMRTPAARPTPTLGGVHLLLVDDDARVRDALQILLERAGAVVETAESAVAGRNALERRIPDVVLSDLAMPNEDGYSFVRKIRQTHGAVSTVPAVAITAHVTEVDRLRALAAGFDLYVTKPVNVEHLISMIARLVEVKHAQK